MQNSSIAFYQDLLPGISNVSLRIRYYGFYAWLADSHARETRLTDSIKDWHCKVRRAEAPCALVAVYDESETGVPGSDWARETLAANPGRITFAEDADPDASGTPYLQQAWGGFGAYRS